MQTKVKTIPAVNQNGEVRIVEQWLIPALAAYELRTDKGDVVQHLSKGKYRVLRTSEELASIDPTAP